MRSGTATIFTAVSTIVFALTVTVCAEDVHRFRGENSQGRYAETGLLKAWPEGGPKRLWLNEDLGLGWSSVIKVGDRLYLNCLDAGDSKMESVVCLDLNGKKIWQTPTSGAWTASYPYPRSTPTYVPGARSGEGKLVTFSGNGTLACLDAKDGKVLWQKELARIYETKFGMWGMAESLIVRDGVIFATVCGNKALAVALKLENGDVVWETPSNGDQCAYVTPILCDTRLIVMTARFVTGIDTKTGKALWQDDFLKTVDYTGRRAGINCNVPLVKGNRFFVSAGYDQGGVMYEILPDDKGIKVVWITNVLDPHHGCAVEVDGRIYGSNWINNGSGNWICLDWETGKVLYDEQWDNLGKGVTIAADGMLYLYEERRGTVGLAKLDADKLDVTGRFTIEFGSNQQWAHPVVCDGVLYVRRGNALAAYDLRAK